MPQSKQTAGLSYTTSNASLHEQERFWTVKEVEQQSSRSKSDELCEMDFLQTRTRGKDGRFTVSLPFRRDPNELGKFRNNTLKQFYKLERKLALQPEVKEQYHKFMNEYAELGRMSLVAETECKPAQIHYIPHHLVTQFNDRSKL